MAHPDKRKREHARAAFRLVLGREARDEAELEAFATIQARGAKPTEAGLRRIEAVERAKLIKAMVAGGNDRNAARRP